MWMWSCTLLVGDGALLTSLKFKSQSRNMFIVWLRHLLDADVLKLKKIKYSP